MSFVGKLDQFRLPDLLQMVATTGKTGKLSLTRRDSQGVVVFRRGKIIYAASTSPRQTLGSLLLCQRLVDDEALTLALEIQHKATEEKRLGSILVEIGALDDETLAAVVTDQIEGVITEFMQWDSGFFKFDLMQLTDKGEVEVDAEDFVHREGLSTQQVLLDITIQLDELEEQQRQAVTAVERESDAAETGVSEATGHELATLRSIMTEIRSPEFTGEATGKILNYARQVLQRGVLFVVRRDGFAPMGRFGLGGEDETSSAISRKLRLPLDPDSILSEAADRKETYRGPLPDNQANRTLVAALGGGQPAEVIVIPLVVNENVLLVLYGVRANGGGPVSSCDHLEMLMLQAGLAMERNLLKRRLEVLEERGRR